MLSHISLRITVAALACTLLLPACSRGRSEGADRAPAAPEGARTAAPLLPLATKYPHAAWRLTTPGSLAPVVLWFSQIVIRHSVVPVEVSFNLAHWSSVRRVTRSRAEAFALAQRVAAEAAREPSRFAELARRYSEDLPSGDEGGAMGAMSAMQMDLWPDVLDALSALRPGEPSRVVETNYGFHIFLRSTPPAHQTMSGSHIVIGHEQAAWLEVYARGERSHRTRAEALALANEIYRQARVEPQRFAELVRRYSEHRDAIADGDFGAWSTLEPNPFPPRTQRLAELEVGQVGAPIETHLGFEVILRSAPRPRAQYRAARRVFAAPVIGADPSRAPTPGARAAVVKQAEALAQRLAHAPAAFAALDSDDAQWVDELQWEDGRGSAELTAALARLRPGEVTPTPVDTEDGLVVAQRLEPQRFEPPAFASELPAPRRRHAP
jgi:parvulin-like peptidyl-prolyl isomerase